MIRSGLALVAVFSSVVYFFASAQSPGRRGPIVRQVDHILVESGDPRALFSFFAEVLQLPVAWPLAESQGYTSGGLGAGNVNLEIFQYADRKNAPARRIPQAHFAGLAFEPYALSNALSEMKLRGIPQGSLEPYVSTLPKGSQGVLWTTVTLPSFSRPGMSLFLYEYSPEFLKVKVRREQLGNRLILNRGGPLGFQSVKEIVIAAANLQKAKVSWTQLLGEPTPSGTWRAGTGPAIRLIPGSVDQIRELICKVESLDRAKAFLKKNRLLGSAALNELSLNPPNAQGLAIRLVN